jgi:hypothetical protein
VKSAVRADPCHGAGMKREINFLWAASVSFNDRNVMCIKPYTWLTNRPTAMACHMREIPGQGFLAKLSAIEKSVRIGSIYDFDDLALA